jgi:hypothetical protein
MRLHHSLSGIPIFLYLPSEVLGVVVRPQHPLRDRFVFEYGGLAGDGMIQLQVAIRSEHPRLMDRKVPAVFTLLEQHRLGSLPCCFPMARCGYRKS